MLKFNSSLKAQLDATSTKLEWANVLKTALGSTRRLRCFRDTSSSASDPATTGTEFLNVGMAGDLLINAGNIVGFGSATGTTTRQAANLLTGTSVLRIEGGGNWVQGTLGLSRAAQTAAGVANGSLVDYDFSLSANPTIASGIGFSSVSQIKANRLMPSGTGPAAPVKTASSPNTIEFYDYTNSASPTLAATVSINTRKDNWVFQDAEMAQSNGDSAIYQSSQDAVWGNFAIGATMSISHKSNGVVTSDPMHAVVVAFTYSSPSWSGYPDQANYDKQAMVLCLPPFKALLKDGNGNTLNTWQMPDGKPINDPSLYSANLNAGDRRSASNIGKALNPKFNCQQGLYWESALPRVSDIAAKIYPGVEASKFRRTMGKSYLTFNSVEPIITGGYDGWTRNGIAHIWVAPAYPLPINATPTIDDPYLDVAPMFDSGKSEYGMGWAEGYAYAPGAMGTHNWYTGPGGPRPDRCVFPSVFAYFMSFPSENRPQGNVPWREIADGFRKNYWNHSTVFVSSASSLTLDTNDKLLNNGWAFVGNYYGDYDYTGKAIRINGDQRDDTNAGDYDSAGNLIRSGHGPDALHDYCNRGMAALLFNSPMFAIGSKLDTVKSFILHRSPDADNSDSYMVRNMAWHWMHHVIAWKLASDHPLGFTQKEIEDRFTRVLKATYTYVYKPAFIDNRTEVKYRCLRNLGTIVTKDGNGNWWNPGGRLGFYMGYVLMLMKQTGFWKRIREIDPINVIVLDNVIRNFDKFCFDTILDTSGYPSFAGNYYAFGSGSTEAGIPSSWSEWASWNTTPAGTDFIHTYNSDTSQVEYKADIDVASNLYRSYAYIRKRFFPEYANARLDQAIAKFDAYEQTVTDMVNAASTIAQKREADHKYAYPGLFIPQAPAVLGPA